MMKLVIYSITVGAFLLLILMWCMTRVDYRIGSRHLKVRLFGLTLRRIALNRILSAHKREPRGFAERWHNTLRSSHRLLTIERSAGLWRYFCITPKNRYVFLSELRAAVRRANPECEWANKTAPEEPAAFSAAPVVPREQRVVRPDSSQAAGH